MAAKNWTKKPPKIIVPSKIELFFAVFSHRATEHNWIIGNSKFSLLLPVRPTHMPTLLSLIFMPPSTAATVLHRALPPQLIVLSCADRSPPPSGSGHHAAATHFYALAALLRRPGQAAVMPPPCSCTIPSLRVPPPPAPPPVMRCPLRRLLRLPSTTTLEIW
jgi:hypothetical protein